MPYAVRFHENGSADALRYESVDKPQAGPGEILVRHTAIGFNFIDVYVRTGAVKAAALPSGIGFEACGTVDAVGPGVDGFRPGQRVAYASAGLGAYSEYRSIPASKAVRVPDGVTDEQAAAVLFKGLTAWYLCHRTHAVSPGDIVLIHAAAGGVGLLLSAWCKAKGARVFGTVGSEAKKQLALDAGCEQVFVLGADDIPARLTAATGGRKARVVYDSVGKDTFALSLDSLARFGLFVSFGAASGSPPPIEVATLNAKGCLFATRPSVFPHIEAPEDLAEGAAAVFGAVASGILPVSIGGRYALREAAQAHRDVEARKTTGSVVLLP
jgi:NADPH:quinone reductase